MTPSDRAALIATARTAAIAECCRALEQAAKDAIQLSKYWDCPQSGRALAEGYRYAAAYLKTYAPDAVLGGTEKAS
jgi:hypothetical protein